jgi:hypothetical protein
VSWRTVLRTHADGTWAADPLRTILAEDRGFYNRDRPHRTLQVESPRPHLRPFAGPIPTVRARPVLSGLHHAYARAA